MAFIRKSTEKIGIKLNSAETGGVLVSEEVRLNIEYNFATIILK
jgi:hypothetical protein